MTVAKSIKQKVDERCIEQRCQRQGCRVKLEGIPKDHILIDMDCHGDSNQTRCDFLFVGRLEAAGDEWLIPIELKRGKVEAGGVRNQLQAGAKVAERLVPAKADIQFRPIVASGRIKQEQSRKLRAMRIVFRGKKFAISRIECGSSITTAI